MDVKSKIIETLSQSEDPITPYSIAIQSKLRVSTVQKAIMRLELNGLVQVKEREKWRTGLQTKRYVLTLTGILEYLASWFPEKVINEFIKESKLEISKISKAMKTHAKYSKPPIFAMWDDIESCLGKDVVCYSIVNAAHQVVHSRKYQLRKGIAGLDHDLTVTFFSIVKHVKKSLSPTITIQKIVEDAIRRELAYIEGQKESLNDLAKSYGLEM